MTASTEDCSAIDSKQVRYDHLEIRCPKLGGQVTFAYCRREGGALPCQRTIICWQSRFPVDAFLQSALTEQSWVAWSHQSPKEKITSLLELIEAAKERLQHEQ